MALLENLPKEIEKIGFEAFVDKILRNYPADEFPELFIHYQRVADKILILGIGKNSECAEQAVHAYQENPELKKNPSETQMIRISKTSLLLR